DQTGDTIPDVATGTGSTSPQSPNPFNNRRISLLSGASGVQLWTASTGLPNFRTLIYRPTNTDGIRVATGGGTDGTDVLASFAGNGSGEVWSFDPGFTPFVIEPIAEAGREDLLVSGIGGRLLRVDGASGDVVWDVSTAGSVTWEVVTLGRSAGPPTVVVGSSSAEVRAYNGATGDVIWTADAIDQAFGLARVPDVDRDGVAEVVVVGKGGSAVLLSGEDGSTIWRYAFGDGSFDQSGEVATAVRDLDANGVPEVAFGTRDGRVILLFGGGGGVGTPTESTPEAPLATLDAPFPSPTAGGPVTLRYRVATAGNVRLAVYDALGREVWTREDTRSPGTYALDVPTSGLASGAYLVRLTTDREAATQRFVLAR
ncbi:MAG: PQQ-binding-like beta-propeller repeat protein, partial [Bacteroidota bacterium]